MDNHQPARLNIWDLKPGDIIAQVRLVSIQPGGSTRILDFREHAHDFVVLLQIERSGGGDGYYSITGLFPDGQAATWTMHFTDFRDLWKKMELE